MVKVVPIPSSLSTLIFPPYLATIVYTMLSPRPVPFPCSLVVKKGSKILCNCSLGIPHPASEIEATTDEYLAERPRTVPP